MRLTQWLIIGFVLLALLLAGVLVVSMLRPPWVEVVGTGVLRTNAPSKLVADLQTAVLDRHKNFIPGADGKLTDPSYKESARGWSAGPSPQVKTAEVTRANIEITDKAGHRISIESITSTGLPTHLFVEYGDPQHPHAILEELLREFEEHGVRVR